MDAAARVKAILDTVPGAGEVEFEAQGRAPVLEILLNRDGLRRHNLQAAAVIGGILSSTFLTLVILPLLYQWIEGRLERNSGS